MAPVAVEVNQLDNQALVRYYSPADPTTWAVDVVIHTAASPTSR
jgi:hypothetical protein